MNNKYFFHKQFGIVSIIEIDNKMSVIKTSDNKIIRVQSGKLKPFDKNVNKAILLIEKTLSNFIIISTSKRSCRKPYTKKNIK